MPYVKSTNIKIHTQEPVIYQPSLDLYSLSVPKVRKTYYKFVRFMSHITFGKTKKYLKNKKINLECFVVK